MTAPAKPWETSAAGRPPVPTAGHVNSSSLDDNLASSSGLPNGPVGQPHANHQPPAVPPRPSQQPISGYGYGYGSAISPYYSRYGYGAGTYGTGAYGYGSGLYGTGGLYGTSGLYGMGGMYGAGGSYGAGSLQQLADESTRGAFHSVEAVVQAFASVSMLLESTYQALYSSFRAVVGVADQFGRLKLHLAQTLSALALVRSLRWLFLRAWYMLRGRNGMTEAAWSQAARAGPAVPSTGPPQPGGSSWPIVAFFGFVVGAPWLLWRIFSAAAHRKVLWASGEEEHHVAVALYDFQPEAPSEIAMKAGQELRLAPKELQPRVRGWLLASLDDGRQVGLVPANYIKVLGVRPPKKGASTEAAPAPP
ncbi:peroxisomal biogenesis factor 13 [Rhipicephalus microplus]|uniref:peroxisomal biogenesis factor 13 n=1 Tax=Rhipicephalus microplus TaxID=6941 RepID=UPI003F6B92AF